MSVEDLNIDTEVTTVSKASSKKKRYGCLSFYLDRNNCLSCISPCINSYLDYFAEPSFDQTKSISIPDIPNFIPKVPPRPSKYVYSLIRKKKMNDYQFSILNSTSNRRKGIFFSDLPIRFLDHFTKDLNLITEFNLNKTLDFLSNFNKGLTIFSPELGSPKLSMKYRIKAVWNYSINVYNHLCQLFPTILSLPSTVLVKHITPYFSTLVEKLNPKFITIYLGSHLHSEFKDFIKVINFYSKEYPDLHLIISGTSAPNRISKLIEKGVKSIISQDWGYYTNRLFTENGWIRLSYKKMKVFECNCHVCQNILEFNEIRFAAVENLMLHNLLSIEEFVKKSLGD